MTKTVFRPELQSLRGVAAFCVALHHILIAVYMPVSAHLVIDVFINGHAAVMLFFVLSGYVLTLSLSKADLGAPAVGAFFVRRAFRIYPALWATLIFALLVAAQGRNDGRLSVSTWYDSMADGFYNPAPAIVALRSMIPFSFRFNPPTWSIFVELVGSLTLPGLILLMRGALYRRWLVTIFLSLLSCGLAIVVPDNLLLHYLFSYLIFFAMGALIALGNPMAGLSKGTLIVVAIISTATLILFRALANLFDAGHLMPITYRYDDPVIALIEGGAASVLIGAVLAMSRSEWLASRPLVWLGDISYSVYLLHFPMLMLSFGFIAFSLGLSGTNGTLLAGAIALLLVFPTSAIIFRYIEQPFMRLGHRVAALIWTR